MSDPIFLENVRVSFPHLTQPHRAKATAKLKYQVDLLMPDSHPGWAAIMQAVNNAAVQRYGEHAQQMLNIINQDRMKRCYGAGNEKINKKTMAPYEGYAGMMYIAPKNLSRPQIIKANGSTVNPSNDMEYMAEVGKIYGGCYVNAAVDIYTSKENDGIFGGLIALQFLKDGESFGDAAPDASGMFGAVQSAPAGTGPSPAGSFNPQPTATPAPADPGMPAAPFGQPKMPDFMGGS